MRHICRICGVRPALALSKHPNARHGIGQKKHHDVCRQCWDSIISSAKARALAESEMSTTPTPAPIHRLVEFDPQGHRYYVDGELVPSVTQVIKDAGMIDDRFFTEYHRWRGSAAHEAIATWNRAGNIDRRTVDPKIRPYLEAAIKWMKDTGFMPMFTEHRMYDPIFNVCGTADMIGYFKTNGKPLVNVFADWKSNDWNQGQLTSKWQLAAYGHAYNPKEIFERIEIVIGPDGNYGPVNSFPVDTYQRHVDEFLALSITARLRREGGLLP